MKAKFIVKILCCIVLLVLADRLVSYLMEHAVHNQRKGDIYELKYEMFETNPAIAILGSSRAKHHYNSEIIEKVTGQKTINLGQNASNIFLHYVLFKTLLLHHIPKVLILDVKPGDFDGNNDPDEFSRLYPMLNEIALSDDDFKAISPYEKIKLWSAAYRYNNKVFEILNNSRGQSLNKTTINGFDPLPVVKNIINNGSRRDSAFDQSLFKYLPLFIQLCKQNNIKLIVCTSPAYINIVFDKTISVTESLCKQDSVVFINYLNNNFLNLPVNMYHDEYHLNANGADIFTEDLAKRIKQLL